jgi:hypothetical protein
LILPASKPGTSHCGIVFIGTLVAWLAAAARVTTLYPSLEFVLDVLAHSGIRVVRNWVPLRTTLRLFALIRELSDVSRVCHLSQPRCASDAGGAFFRQLCRGNGFATGADRPSRAAPQCRPIQVGGRHHEGDQSACFGTNLGPGSFVNELGARFICRAVSAPF